jgi:mRNA interferase RelE/StbE
VAFAVFIKESAQRELEELPKRDRALVERRIIALAEDPRPQNATALKGERFKGLYRIRSGDYRVIYQVQDTQLIVLVVKIGNRKDVYD